MKGGVGGDKAVLKLLFLFLLEGFIYCHFSNQTDKYIYINYKSPKVKLKKGIIHVLVSYICRFNFIEY